MKQKLGWAWYLIPSFGAFFFLITVGLTPIDFFYISFFNIFVIVNVLISTFSCFAVSRFKNTLSYRFTVIVVFSVYLFFSTKLIYNLFTIT